MNKYSAHGLCIESHLDLEPLLPIRQSIKTDLNIVFGTVPEHGIETPSIRKAYVQIKEKLIWIEVPDVVRMLISDGNSIVLEKINNADDASVRLFVLGSGLGAILHQRGYLVLHANAIQLDKGVILITGASGAGKSTSATAFSQKGYQVISDDIVALNELGNVIGGFPQIKLWKDALEKLGISDKTLKPVRPKLEKYSLPNIKKTSKQNKNVIAIYTLCINESLDQHNPIEIVDLQGITKFNHLKAHTYRRFFMEGLDHQKEHLQLSSYIAAQTHMARIDRPSSRFTAHELVDQVLGDLKNMGLD